jgi:hypothetical protein
MCPCGLSAPPALLAAHGRHGLTAPPAPVVARG